MNNVIVGGNTLHSMQITLFFVFVFLLRLAWDISCKNFDLPNSWLSLLNVKKKTVWNLSMNLRKTKVNLWIFTKEQEITHYFNICKNLVKCALIITTSM